MFKLRYFPFLLIALSFIASGCEKEIESAGSDPVNRNLNLKAVGASANELLSAAKPSVVIELQYMKGHQLQPSTVNNLVSFIQAYLNKPGGVQVLQKEIAASSKSTLTTTEIAEIEKNNRLYYSTSRQVAVYILVTNGVATDANTIGVAYRNTSVSLFGKTLQRFSTGYSLTFKGKLETSTINHEFGHLLGLVNVGSKMQTAHSDGNHAGHCNNSKCLMYYKAEGGELINYVKGGTLPTLDANCLADLKANGGK